MAFFATGIPVSDFVTIAEEVDVWVLLDVYLDKVANHSISIYVPSKRLRFSSHDADVGATSFQDTSDDYH